MEMDRIINELNDIFREAFARDDLNINPDFTAQDIEGWDSFRHIEILLATEDRFNIKFSAAEIEKLDSVNDLINLIKIKL